MTVKNTDWPKRASSLIKMELVRRNMSYEQLAAQLNALDIHETQRSIANKLSRGTFPFTFFLQCAKAIGLNQLRLDEI